MTLLLAKYRRHYLLAEIECCKEGRVFCPLVVTNEMKDEQR